MRSSNASDRRRLYRFVDNAPTRLETPEREQVPARIVNVSRTGLALRSERPLTSTTVRCKLQMGRQDVMVSLRIVWRHSDADGYEYGAVLRRGQNSVLDGYVKQILRQAGRGLS